MPVQSPGTPPTVGNAPTAVRRARLSFSEDLAVALERIQQTLNQHTTILRGIRDLLKGFAVTDSNGVFIGFKYPLTKKDVTLTINPVDSIKLLHISGDYARIQYSVVEVAKGNGDIAQLGTASVSIVRGANTMILTPTSFSLSLPAANPGAGSKAQWYDPADGNRVKFAP